MTPSRDEKSVQAGYTPGPWSAEGPDQFGDYNIHCQHERAVVTAVISNLRPSTEVAANARLIAAAPDLLEALQNASGLLDTPLGRRRHADDSFYDAVVQSIRAALATAKIGGAS